MSARTAVQEPEGATANGRVLRMAGAVAVLVGGAIHLRLAFDAYGTGDIQTAFFVNALVSGVVAAYLVLRPVDPIGPLAGIALSVASLAAFALTRVGDGVLGFRATGLDPSPEAPLTLIVEVAAVALLVAVLLTERSRPASTRP